MVGARLQEVSAARGGRASEIEGAGVTAGRTAEAAIERYGRAQGGGDQRRDGWAHGGGEPTAGCSEKNPTLDGGGRAERRS